MWPVLVLQFNWGFLRNDAEGAVYLIFLFLILFWAIFCVLGFVRKLLIIHFTGMFYLIDVASIGVEIQLQALRNDQQEQSWYT